MGGTAEFAQVIECPGNKRAKGDSEIKVGLGRRETENATKDTKALSFEERLCVKTARAYDSKRRFKAV